jgi:large subunit ribosomal protein L23
MGKSGFAEDIIIVPLLTEKSWGDMEENKYTFRVAVDANKVEIQRAVEELFKVRVRKVWTANRKGKPKRERMNQLHGRTPRWRKAIVKLAPGDHIDIVGG